MAELVYASDLKSDAHMGLRVQVPPGPLRRKQMIEITLVAIIFFMAISADWLTSRGIIPYPPDEEEDEI